MCRLFIEGKVINAKACELAREVAAEGNALMLGGVSQTPTYLTGMKKEEVKDVFRRQVKVFVDEKVDFLLCEVSGCGKWF